MCLHFEQPHQTLGDNITIVMTMVNMTSDGCRSGRERILQGAKVPFAHSFADSGI